MSVRVIVAWISISNTSTLQTVVDVFAIVGGVYAALKFFGILLLWARGPKIRLYVADRIWPVGHTGQGNITVQLHFSLHNKGWRVGVLQRLEVTLTTPQKVQYILPWEIFLDAKPEAIVPKSPVYPVPLAAKDFASLAVQCRGAVPDLHEAFDWPMGNYMVAIAGWINGRRKVLTPTGNFRFQIDGLGWGLLSDRLNQPSQPIAHSVDVINWHERRGVLQTIRWYGFRWLQRNKTQASV